MAIMPQGQPEIAGVDVAGICLPASEVGGDFFDYFPLEGGSERLCIAVGDVAGKGMKAAMTAVMSDGMVFSRVRQGAELEEIMANLNRSLHLKLENRMFTALCLVIVDSGKRQLRIANAGLCEPLLCSAGEADYLSTPGDRYPLGAVSGARYESSTVQLRDSDVVVLFTDGVAEARQRNGELYGYERPRALLQEMDTECMSAAEIRDALVAHVRSFSGDSRQNDDMAVVVLKLTH
jgi:sigma-B regulation protein RsbU (phosphoserine phosphatase)